MWTKAITEVNGLCLPIEASPTLPAQDSKITSTSNLLHSTPIKDSQDLQWSSKRQPDDPTSSAAKRGKTNKANLVASIHRYNVLADGIGPRLLNDPEYSDLEIHCRREVFKVHRNIVCRQSKFLKACINATSGGFKEAQEGIIDLPDDEPHVVELLVQFLYTDDYVYQAQCLQNSEDPAPKTEESHASVEKVINDKVQEEAAQHAESEEKEEEDDEKYYEIPDHELTAHTKVYIIADKFDIPDLKNLAREKFREALSEDQLDIFTSVFSWVNYNTHENDNGLRQLCMDFATKNFKLLMDRGEWFTFCEQDGKFTAALLRQIAHTSKAHVVSTENTAVASSTAGASLSVPNCPLCKSGWDVSLSTRGQQAKHGFKFRCYKCRHNFQD
ncbi:hypothetical protein HYALB_00013400 [Hymenoscyphus albidus]|uniref:BTB domain-containing protein n=1 Tax=Hymenoscyphus albidus TaxID=595503 RepID=A0A9N9QA46_9HELO|nr:hypothetical protein HYALB_00013400 [Hymenoscyphus albidus]